MKPTKRNKRKLFQYSHDDMERAIQYVREGCSQRVAAERASVPQSTLSERLNKIHPDKLGSAPIFTPAEEETIVRYCENMRQLGYPRTDAQILEDANDILKRTNRQGLVSGGKLSK